MEQKKVSESIADLTDQVRNYVRLRIDLFKLDLTEKLATLTTTLIISIIFFIVFLFFTLFLSLAFIFWFKEYAGDAWVGALIVAGFYILVGILVYFLRDRLFLNRIVVQISKILLEEEEQNEE
jgi:amino acid transporter